MTTVTRDTGMLKTVLVQLSPVCVVLVAQPRNKTRRQKTLRKERSDRDEVAIAGPCGECEPAIELEALWIAVKSREGGLGQFLSDSSGLKTNSFNCGRIIAHTTPIPFTFGYIGE